MLLLIARCVDGMSVCTDEAVGVLESVCVRRQCCRNVMIFTHALTSRTDGFDFRH